MPSGLRDTSRFLTDVFLFATVDSIYFGIYCEAGALVITNLITLQMI